MTEQEIQELARHRKVPSWVIKLVADAVAHEREACARVSDEWVKAYPHPSETIAAAIRARGKLG